MKFLLQVLVAIAISLGGAAHYANAGDTDPLFVNLTTDDSHRSTMAIGFGANQLERGHPLTIFLNDKGVLIGAKANAAKFPDQQKALSALVGKGATIIVCPSCMKQFGIQDSDLLPGLKVGKPEITGGALFKDNTKTLTW
jgi:sulfur relay (sulfurtransferase) complex TusBCD TusD component (DsrE family)